MYLNILLLPFLGALSAGLLGRKLGIQGSQYLTSILLIITTILGIKAFIDQAYFSEDLIIIELFDWLKSGILDIKMSITFDILTVSMLLPVLIISTLVHIYSIGYMSHDPHQQRFFSYLSMFTFFMLILITGNNYLLMFVGWEGVGISSYLLVNFWFTRYQANKSAISAILVNRVGDMFLTIGLFLIICTFGSLDYDVIYAISPHINEDVILVIGLLLLIGAMAKSAQLGLHIWLPQAMEGATPVSALIHAATMVTAGVYLFMRSSPLIEYSSTLLLITMWIGGLTAIFAATTGLFQNDIKKIIAYSTCSQLGMLFIAIGLSQYNLALFHLVNHAFFKALLFLGAGSVIHSMNDEQDFRKLGGLVNYLPFSYTMILIGSLSLMALPFLTGYYSKDFIIESTYGQYTLNGLIMYWIVVISGLCTGLYSIKLISLTFLTKANGKYINYIRSHEPSLYMGVPLIILSIFSIFFGYLFKELFIGIGSPFNKNSMYIHPNHTIFIETEYIPLIIKLLPVILTIIGSIICVILYVKYSEYLRISNRIYSFFNQRYYFELILHKLFINKGLSIGYICNKYLDRGILESYGPTGLKDYLTKISKYLSYPNSINNFNTISVYSLYIFIGLVSIMCVFFSTVSQLIILLLLTILFI